jgi:hypothetical protein
VYTAAGTQQTGAHQVIGTVVTNAAGNGSVTFTGSAVFSSATSYQCSVTALASASSATAAAISTPVSNGFTVKGANSTTYGYICVGN